MTALHRWSPRGDHAHTQAWPRITVVTPSFNQGHFLETTIRSVLDQDYQNLEYIVIDGGSTDGSVDIIRKYAPRLAYWVSEPDQGQADAIAKGFRRSTGEILAYLNSDDVYLSGTITQVVAAFQRHPPYDLIYGDVWIVNEQDQVIGERRLTHMDDHDFLGQGNCLAQPATFWTRQIYDEVGGIDPSLYFQMDLDFYIRVARAGRMRHLRRHLAKVRMHAEGKMVKADDIRRGELALLQQRYVPEGQLSLWRYAKPWLRSRQLVRCVLQGDFSYASAKILRRLRHPRADSAPEETHLAVGRLRNEG